MSPQGLTVPKGSPTKSSEGQQVRESSKPLSECRFDELPALTEPINVDVPIHEPVSRVPSQSSRAVSSTAYSSGASTFPRASTYPPIDRTQFMYKEHIIADRKLPMWASPKVQIFLVSLVCFCDPGLFNAMNGLGGAGLSNTNIAATANALLYLTFFVSAFISCPFCNVIGVKWGLVLGTIGYDFYAAAFFYYKVSGRPILTLPAAVLLGITAGSLWAAQGGVMLSYPDEKQKGRSIAWFWAIFNLGGVVGAIIPVVANIDATYQGSVSESTYIWILSVTILGTLLALTLCRTENVVRADGSRVIMQRYPTFQTEMAEMYYTIRDGFWVIVPITPMFFSSNIFYTWQFNAFNAGRFNVRTRAVNNLNYWVIMTFGPIVPGYLLDLCPFTRSQKAKVLHGILFVFMMIVWGMGYRFELKQPPRSVTELPDFVGIDFTDKNYPLHLVQFIMLALFSALWQNAIYWLIGALTNSNRRAVNITGFYKGLQSLGAAMAWRFDATGMEYKEMLVITWTLLAMSLFLATPVIWFKIQDHTPIEEDIHNHDITATDVAAPAGSDGTSPQIRPLRFSQATTTQLLEMQRTPVGLRPVRRTRSPELDLEAAVNSPPIASSNHLSATPPIILPSIRLSAPSPGPIRFRSPVSNPNDFSNSISRPASFVEGDDTIPLDVADIDRTPTIRITSVFPDTTIHFYPENLSRFLALYGNANARVPNRSSTVASSSRAITANQRSASPTPGANTNRLSAPPTIGSNPNRLSAPSNVGVNPNRLSAPPATGAKANN